MMKCIFCERPTHDINKVPEKQRYAEHINFVPYCNKHIEEECN